MYIPIYHVFASINPWFPLVTSPHPLPRHKGERSASCQDSRAVGCEADSERRAKSRTGARHAVITVKLGRAWENSMDCWDGIHPVIGVNVNEVNGGVAGGFLSRKKVGECWRCSENMVNMVDYWSIPVMVSFYWKIVQQWVTLAVTRDKAIRSPWVNCSGIRFVMNTEFKRS